jgi:hypothetical protein
MAAKGHAAYYKKSLRHADGTPVWKARVSGNFVPRLVIDMSY